VPLRSEIASGLALRWAASAGNAAALSLVLFSAPARFGYVGRFIAFGLLALALLPLAAALAVAGERLHRARLPTAWAGRTLSVCGAVWARIGHATPLSDPVLDHALPLRADAPERIAGVLGGNEQMVLAVLHTGPLSRLEPGAVVWEADVAQLADALARSDADLGRLLQDQVTHAVALARVFDAPAPE
jgi:hypothetical protein